MSYFRPRHRGGALLLIVLVAFAVVSVLLVVVVQTTLSDRRAVQREVRDLQAIWLAESGVERAAARLRTDPTYKGETWNISADALGGTKAGVVLIEIEHDAKDPALFTVRARADYPDHPQQRSRQTKQLRVEVSS